MSPSKFWLQLYSWANQLIHSSLLNWLSLSLSSMILFCCRRFLNNAEIAPYVPGANYTFFVPIDDAFIKHGFSKLSEDDMATETAIKFLLNHFIKGRLYDRNLKHEEVFESIGGTGLKIQRLGAGEYSKFLCRIFKCFKLYTAKHFWSFVGNVTVNHVQIVESEIFVYNLGTMYYIDDILYPEIFDKILKAADTTTSVPTTIKLTTSPDAEIEQVPIEMVTQSNEPGKDIFVLNERGGVVGGGSVGGPNIDGNSNFDRDLDTDEEDEDDDEIITPRALPVQFMVEPPK